jgi:signal transduction histidine kinase/ActR/RegA family two-component response regulator
LQLKTFSASLLQQHGLEDLLWHIAGQVGEVFGFEDCVVYLLEGSGLVQYAAHGVKSPALREIKNRLVVPLGSGIVGSVAVSGRPECIADTRNEPRYITDEFEGRSELAVPISYGGRVIGVLDCESSQPDGFTAADQAALEVVATLSAPRIASAIAERGMHRVEAELHRVEGLQVERERQYHTERLESLGQLAGGIAHDFNNLLTAILGNVAMARDDVEVPHVLEMLDEAALACDRARALTKQLLTFATGGAPVRIVDDLAALLTEEAAAAARGTGLRLQFDLPSEPLRAAFDREQMRQVVRHLVINAAEAQPGGGCLKISGRHVLNGDLSQIEIRWHDDGPGVPEHLQTRVFDPYFTTKLDGSGLGLSSSFWVARRHGGVLELDAQVESGACFVLRLPAVSDSRAGAKRPISGVPPARLRVLLLDDDAAVRLVVVRMLTGLGHEVMPVADGASCVREFTAAHTAGRAFDLAILDLTLPGGMDGIETLHALRQIVPDLPAVVASGYHDTAALADPELYGFVARLEKPFTSSVLQESLQEAMVAHRRSPAP